ncbi:L-ascorbate oxidase [Mycena belliarum]|uniref:Peroxidase n=1 Tax=Mycena belliarum TaxID=1033014 RepID=A0AAD6XVY1_9AGAR|nr:L-ascorbate oxidase [Mycena belliae]
MLNLPLSLVASFLLWSVSVRGADYRWPSLQYDALEEFLYEGIRPDGSSMADLVRPCKMRGGTNTTVAAEWLRLVYHDTATHNISDGTGGLDGSIFFETHRAESFGAGMNNTLNDFSAFPNKYVTRADLIAVATVWAVATCSGPVIPIRGGRVDAETAGPFGVPTPADSLESLTANFAKQGFNVTEMIQLVACGHTLGGVRSPDFPTIVSPGSNPSDVVIALFDDTQQFDHKIITQYLDSTTQDPLITFNQTMASDRRIFGSDNNATMQSMATPESFSSTCVKIIDKMLNTVPSTVTLTDEITLLPVKVSAVQLTLAGSQMQFQASVRLIQSTSTTSVNMYWCDRYGAAADCKSGLKRFAAPGGSSTVSSPTSEAMGVTLKKYQFVVPVDVSQSVAKFWFVVDYGNGTKTVADNGGTNYVVEQDDVLWVPSQSRAKSVLTGSHGWLITAAVKTATAPKRVYMDCFGRATTNYIALNATFDLALNSSLPAVGGYEFYTGTAMGEFGQSMSFELTSVAADGKVAVDTYRQAGLIGVALAATSAVNTTTSSSVGGKSGAWAVAPPWGVLGLLSVWTLATL